MRKLIGLAIALLLPVATWAAANGDTSTYSTYSNDTDTPSAYGAFTTGQAFQLNATWMFNTSGDDIASSSAAVKVESIAVKWASGTHANADIGHNKGGEQPDAYLVVTTPQDVIVGVSGVNDAKWVANGTSTFAFTDLVLASNAQYIYYFATDDSGLAVGQVLAANKKKNGRVLCAWHGSTHANDTVVHIINSNQYSINSIFTVSAAQTDSLTTASEAVALNAGSYPVFVTGAVANGIVNVASDAAVPALTVVGQATTLKLADSLAAMYLYLPAATTIDASSVSFALPSGDETTKETVLVEAKISSSSNPTVTLPTLAEGYAFEPVVYDDTGIKVTVSKPVDATVTLVNGTELLWSNVKPAGWINSAVPTITIDNTSNAGTLVFDENVQAAKIVLPDGWAANIKRRAGVTVDIPYFSCPKNFANHTFTDFEAIPQTVQNTTAEDKITAAGTETLTYFPQIGTGSQAATLSIAQKATFAGNGFNVVGSKTININTGADISAARFVLGNDGGVTQTVNQNGGTITVTGSAAPTSNQASILLGHWGNGATATLKTLGGTFTANNVASRLGWDGTATWQIGGGTSAAKVNVYGIVNGGSGHSGTGTLNIMANGTLNLGAGGIDFNNSGNSGNINLAGGTIDTGASAVTITNAKDGGTIINQNKTTTINVSNEKTLTVNAVLSGTGVGTLNKTGEGKMILAKTATTKGKLLVSAGTVEFNEGINWGSNGTVEIGQNGTLNVLTSESVAEGELLVAGAFTVSGTVLNNGTAVDIDVKSTGIYVAMPPVTITVPAVANATATATIGGEPVALDSNGHADVPAGSVVTVTYAANAGYQMSGTTEYTIDTATATTFELDESTKTARIVAQIKTGATSYEYYTTLAAALDSENIAYGITLLADVTENNVTVDSAATITGNHTINANVTIANGGQLQLMLAALNGTLTIQDGGTYVTLGGTLGNVVVQDGGIINLTTLSEDTAGLTISTLTVNGALTIVSSYGLAERGKTYKAISYVTGNATIAEGASFNGSGEWSASTTVDGDNTVVCLEITKVAVVDGVYYDTAQEAVEAAVASGKQAEFLVQPGTVTLGAGETLVVKGGYQPTVELDAGLSTPPYEVQSGYDINTGIYTYAVKSYVAQIGDTKYESVADAVAAATSGQTVKLLADVTLTDKLVVSNKTVTITADSAKTITGQLRVVDGSNVTIGTNVTITSDKHPTVFVLGDPAVKTAGTAKSVLVVNGTVLNTNAGFDQTFAIAGNGLDTKGVDITINGTVRNANGIAIYQAFPGDLVVNGTVEGASAISIKDGTLTVNSGAVVRATLASGAAYVGNNNGDSPTGDAIIAPYYDLSLGYGTPVVSIAGGEITVTDTENCTGIEAYDFEGATAPNDSASNVNVSGGTFNTAVSETYCAEGFEPKDNGNGTYGVRVDKGWIYEDADFPNYTGAWSRDGVALDLVYDSETGKAAIEDGATYTASKPSDGRMVTLNMTIAFDDACSDDEAYEGVKAAVRLGEGETEGTYVFQLYTTNELGAAAWLDATASGVTPTIDQDYAFAFVLDMTNKTYTVTVDGFALTVDGAETLGFASANASDTVQSIEFAGAGKVSSIQGSYEDVPVPEGFAEDDTFGDVTLTAAQAAWLNGQANYDALAAKIKTMDATAFNDAYLLNLDILDANSDYTFAVKGIVVGEDKVDVTVTLTRTGALTENEKAKPIVGTLKLKGTAILGTEFTVLGEKAVEFDANAKFGDGATETTVTVDTAETDAKFYQPVIE